MGSTIYTPDLNYNTLLYLGSLYRFHGVILPDFKTHYMNEKVIVTLT